MKPTPEMIAAGVKASYDLRDNGIPSEGIKPVTTTAALSLHVREILKAGLALVPDPKQPRSPRPRRAS